MVTMDATTVKNRFGEAIDKARKEPVMVTKSGREVAVIISADEYKYLEAVDNYYWVLQAREGIASGFVGQDEVAQMFRDRLGYFPGDTEKP